MPTYHLIDDQTGAPIGGDFVAPNLAAAHQVAWLTSTMLGKPARLMPSGPQFVASEMLGAYPEPQVTKRAYKYPGECPCGISARQCDYHRDL